MKDIIGLILAVLILFGGCGNDTSGSTEEKRKLELTTQDITIQIPADAAPVLQALGEPIQYTEVPSCAFEGMEKTYFYGSFYITTRPEAGKESICTLWFADDSIATDEGVRIGDPREAVEAAYGTNCRKEEDEYVIEGDDSKLTILVKDGSVSHILYEEIIP